MHKILKNCIDPEPAVKAGSFFSTFELVTLEGNKCEKGLRFGDLVVKVFMAEGTDKTFYVESWEYFIIVDERKWDRGVYNDGPNDEVCLYSQSRMVYEWWDMNLIAKAK